MKTFMQSLSLFIFMLLCIVLVLFFGTTVAVLQILRHKILENLKLNQYFSSVILGADSFGGTYTGNKEFEFVAESTTSYIYIGFPTTDNNVTIYFDNISVYKKQATLSTPITPMSFLETPVFVASETPVDFREDEHRVVRNVMESTAFSGLVELNENRKVLDLGTIFNNNRYVIDNPFGNEKYMDCDVKAEIYVGDIWIDPSSLTDGASPYFVLPYSKLEGIVIQTGYSGLFASLSNYGGGSAVSGALAHITSAPARVIITYIGETKQ